MSEMVDHKERVVELLTSINEHLAALRRVWCGEVGETGPILDGPALTETETSVVFPWPLETPEIPESPILQVEEEKPSTPRTTKQEYPRGWDTLVSTLDVVVELSFTRGGIQHRINEAGLEPVEVKKGGRGHPPRLYRLGDLWPLVQDTKRDGALPPFDPDSYLTSVELGEVTDREGAAAAATCKRGGVTGVPGTCPRLWRWGDVKDLLKNAKRARRRKT